jgi:hypothetical protein
MSTIPFVQVEGAIALPRVLPLDHIPPPFGREWMLLPPHFSLRAEMKALYAAIMRTVCLSAEAFRATCRWDLRGDPNRRTMPEPAAAPVGALAESAHSRAKAVLTASAPFSVVPAAPAVPLHTETSQRLRTADTRRTPAPDRSRLAGGACAIGGAALLTWILASHAPHSPNSEKHSAVPSPAHADHESGSTEAQRLADARTTHDIALADSQPIPQTTQVSEPPAPLQAPPQIIVPAPRVDVVPTASQPDYFQSHREAAQRATLVPPRPAANREKHLTRQGAGNAKSTTANKARGELRVANDRHAVHTFAPHHEPHVVTTHRTAGMYSKAGHYSPRRPVARHSDEYASISTYMAPRPTIHASVPVDSTEWVNHVSQRRVTEVPDSFAK